MAVIGFIGLGIMGKPMCRNLLRAGYSVLAYDVVAASVAEVAADGARSATSCAAAAADANVVITMLPDGPEVEEAILGSDGVLEGARQGTIVVDMSSVNPAVSQKVASACERKGVAFLDAPVSGGEPKAIEGTLAIMVGGALEAFEKVLPILQKMGSNATLTGAVGAGNVTKLANQIMVACNIAAMGEALVLATKAGVDPEAVFNAVKGGLAGSAVLNAKAPLVISRNFKPGFRVTLHEKDLRNALLVGESMKVALPFTSLAQQVLIGLMNDGKGNLDHSAMVTIAEKMSGIEIAKPVCRDV